MVKLLLILVGLLALGGLGAVFVWSSLNELLHGDASWGRIAAMVCVLVVMFGLLGVGMRVVRDLDAPQSR